MHRYTFRITDAEGSLSVKCGNSTIESQFKTTLTWRSDTSSTTTTTTTTTTLSTVMTQKSSSHDKNREKTDTYPATESTTAVVYASQHQMTSVELDNMICKT